MPRSVPADPRLWQRLLVSALALAALAAVAWPSAFHGGRLWLYTEWPWQATIAVGNLAAAGAALLALLLAWRSADPAAPHLAASLGLGALAFGLGSDPVLPGTSTFVPTLLDAAILAAAVLAGAAFMRFSVLYPKPLTVERMALWDPRRTGTDDPSRAPEAQLPMERAGSRIAGGVRAWRRGITPGWAHRLAERMATGWKRGIARIGRKAPPTLQKDVQSDVQRVVYRVATRAWRYGAVIAAGAAALILLGAREAAEFVALFLGILPIWGYALLRISYGVGGDEDRRKILWILQGFLLLIGIQALVVYSFMIPTLFSDSARLLMLKLWPPAVALGALAMVLCLAIAVFWAGALDPGRALRSTVVYGGLGLVLTVVFALMENVASEYVVGWVGLPGNYAVLLSTAVTAVVFSALHRRFERAASGLFGGVEPDEETIA